MISNVDLNQIAQRLSYLEVSDREIPNLEAVLTYLNQYPDQLVWRKKIKPKLDSINGLVEVGSKYIESLRKEIIPSKPKTVPDKMVSVIMESFYGYPEEGLENIKRAHQDSMAAENIVGELLEAYIRTMGEPLGWVHCTGSVIKAIDFLKKDKDGWILLQVKNRDNSENSSSSAIRSGTSIKKWFRTFSSTGETNWPKFPDPLLAKRLSEPKFAQFVETHMKRISELRNIEQQGLL